MKFFTKYLRSVLFLSLFSFAYWDVDPGSSAGGGDNNAGDSEKLAWEDPKASEDGQKEDSPSKQRFKISQAKKMAADAVIKWEDPFAKKSENPGWEQDPKLEDPKSQFDINSPEVQEALGKLVQEKLSKYDFESLSEISNIKSQREKDAFFKNISEWFESYKSLGMDTDPKNTEQVLYNIEENGWTSWELFLLQNQEEIFKKLGISPKIPMNSDGWQAIPAGWEKPNMGGIVDRLWSKYGGK